MKFIQKIFYIFINLFFISIILFYLKNKIKFQTNIIDTTKTWLYYVLPSISISYICSLFLINFPFISKLLYPILKPIFNFENYKSCSIFLVSIIVGNPTTIKLITTAEKDNEISSYEANRLISFTNFISSVFIFSVFSVQIALFILIIELISAVIIANITKQNPYNNQSKSTNKSILTIYFDIINTLPNLLLSILCSMIFCSTISFIFNFEYFNIFLELTNGIILINTMDNSTLKILLLIILISSNGLAIVLQSYFIIKKSSLSFTDFIKYHLVSVLISVISLIITYIIYTFLSVLH